MSVLEAEPLTASEVIAVNVATARLKGQTITATRHFRNSEVNRWVKVARIGSVLVLERGRIGVRGIVISDDLGNEREAVNRFHDYVATYLFKGYAEII